MDKKLKIIFVGIPDMALVTLDALINAGFNIVCVVPPQKDHETYSYFKDFVLSKGLKFFSFEKSPNDKDFIEKLKSFCADIGVVCSYNKLFSKDFLQTTKMGYINCHPSYLPKYRGAAPYFHIVKNGEEKSAVTLHFMDEKFDTGDIIYQKEFELTPFETMGTLFNRTNFMFCDALVEVLGKIQSGQKIERIKQNKTDSFLTAPRVEGNFRLRWNKKASEIDCLIRACNPFYNVYTTFRGASFRIIKARLVEPPCDYREFEPGKVIKADDKYLIVSAQDGFLSLEIFQVGTWGVFNTESFYYNFSPEVSEYFI